MPGEMIAALPLLLPLAFLGGLAGGSTGFGIYLVLGPALWTVLSPTESMGVALSSGLPLWALLLPLWPDLPWPRTRSILLWTLPGLALGICLHLLLADPLLEIGAALAIFIAIATRYQIRRQIGTRPAGVLAGALSTSVGFNGPPVFLGLSSENERAMRGGIIFCLMILSLAASLILLIATGGEFVRGYIAGFLLLPAVGLGVWLGHIGARLLGSAIEVIAVAVSLGGALLLLLRGLPL